MNPALPTLDQTDLSTDTQSPVQTFPQESHTYENTTVSAPVEMSNMPAGTAVGDHDASASSAVKTTSQDSTSGFPHGPVRTDTTTAIDQSLHPPPPPTDTLPVTRTFSTAIGPSSDSPVVPAKDSESAGPTLLITLLLTSGARHPFKLDHKYLNKRNVDVPQNDPFNLSVYKLKELVLREWRDEWEAKPSSPNYIRLISFGKLLEDKAPLKGMSSSATYILKCIRKLTVAFRL
jgi:hypothetical protein